MGWDGKKGGADKMRKIVFQLILWIIVFASAIAVQAMDGQIKIAQTSATTFPILIDQPGSYVLTSNLVMPNAATSAITIVCNDVTLDLNGHTIKGGGTGVARGIYAHNRYSITVRNGIVWGFGNGGVILDSDSGDPSDKGSGHMVDHIIAPSNLMGIVVHGGMVTHCTASNNPWYGIAVRFGVVQNCIANNSSYYMGISAWASSVSHCVANNNGDDGISIRYGTLTQCTVMGNQKDGIDASDSTVSYCNAHGNTGNGLRIYSDCIVRACNARANGEYGILVLNPGNYLNGNAASDNTSGQIFGGSLSIDNGSF